VRKRYLYEGTAQRLNSRFYYASGDQCQSVLNHWAKTNAFTLSRWEVIMYAAIVSYEGPTRKALFEDHRPVSELPECLLERKRKAK
jgi:hypothetical protein